MYVVLFGDMKGNLRENGEEVMCKMVGTIPKIVDILISTDTEYEYNKMVMATNKDVSNIRVPFDELINGYLEYLNIKKNNEKIEQ